VAINPVIHITLRTRWLVIVGCVLTTACLAFCLFYLFSDHAHLAGWYTGMNGCFYRHDDWLNDFFNLHTKSQGNLFCTAGPLISLYLLFVLIKRLKQPGKVLKLQHSRQNFYLTLLCIAIGTSGWLWGNSLVHQGFDEVFSAVNCASLPPFQTLSYYMLPNNHILFNLLNSVLFHFADDKVFTGKLISLVCFWGIIAIVFAWLSTFIKNKFLLVVATVLITFQFPIWGFGFEARGYELYALAGWVAFFTMLKYLNSKDTIWLYYYILGCIAGYCCVPTFLYFHIALLGLGLCWGVYNRTFDRRFWQSQIIVGLAVFLFYLPAICFSGIRALAGNQYVAGQINSLHDFFLKSKSILNDYLNFYTSDFGPKYKVIAAISFLLPLALFCFYKNRMAVLCGVFYLAMWITCIMLASVMRIYPIDRTMIGHLNITLGLSIYALYLVVQKIRIPAFKDAVFAVLLIGTGVCFFIGNRANVGAGLYNNDINIKYNLLKTEGIDFIPENNSIGFSDECFYWYYLCKLRGDKVTQCPTGNEQYMVVFKSDDFPAPDPEKYVLLKTVFKYGVIATGYDIYKHR
jgi:hypothetical protein